MQLFIVGNGFDIAHGLPTCYWDFRRFLKNKYPDFLRSFEQHYDIYPRGDEKAQKKMLWNEFETNLANIDEDTIVGNAVSIEMGLESGDVGIEDTLVDYFTEEYKYIRLLQVYIKRWIKAVKIKNMVPKTSKIGSGNDALFITYNYTAVLEKAYDINEDKIIHIHGSLRIRDGDPVLGHGNIERIEKIKNKRNEAANIFSEKEVSIYRVIEEYYNRTFKDIKLYMPKLWPLREKNISEIIVVGHSLAGIDIPYLKMIDNLTGNCTMWKVYYYDENSRERMIDGLTGCGINHKRIELLHSSNFFDL